MNFPTHLTKNVRDSSVLNVECVVGQGRFLSGVGVGVEAGAGAVMLEVEVTVEDDGDDNGWLINRGGYLSSRVHLVIRSFSRMLMCLLSIVRGLPRGMMR